MNTRSEITTFRVDFDVRIIIEDKDSLFIYDPYIKRIVGLEITATPISYYFFKLNSEGGKLPGDRVDGKIFYQFTLGQVVNALKENGSYVPPPKVLSKGDMFIVHSEDCKIITK